MEEVAAKRDKEIRPGFVLSILLHVLLAAFFLLPLMVAPPQAKPEDSVNVELVPQPQEKQEIATKTNEKPDQPPKPTPKPDEKPQQQTPEAKQEQQPQGQKPDEQPPKQSDAQSKEQAEKPAASKPVDAGADKPVEKAEQQPSATETPLPDMKGDQKDPTTTQDAKASAQPDEKPQTPPNDSQAEQQAAAEAAAEAAAQKAEQAQNTQPPADAKDQQANAATPPAVDTASKPPASAPNVLTTNEPSDTQVQQSPVPSTGENGSQAQDAAEAPSSDPQIAVPAVKPSPTQQTSQSQSASNSQGDQTSGTALVTEPQPKSDAPKRAVQAKKLYSGAEMGRLSKSDYDAWKKMPRRQRVAYLCNSEEKLQYRHDLGAVGYVNSALSPAMVSDTSLFGNGVAVQTPNGWQRVEFTCQVDGDALKVVAFSYTVKGQVSPSQLDRLGFAGN